MESPALQERPRGSVSHRRRLLEGLERCLARKPFLQTTIADIVEEAQTSRREFYRCFDTREACLAALHDDATNEQAALIEAAVNSKEPWAKQIQQAVEAWIDYADARPAVMLSWIRDVPLLGQVASELQHSSTEAMASVIQGLSQSDDYIAQGGKPISKIRAVVLLGALEMLTLYTVGAGEEMGSVRQEAVAASIALMGYATSSEGAPAEPRSASVPTRHPS